MSKLSQSVILVLGLGLTVLAFPPPPLWAQPGCGDLPSVNVDPVDGGWRVHSEGLVVVTGTKYEEITPGEVPGKRKLTPMTAGETRIFIGYRDITIFRQVLHFPCPDCGPCRTGDCPPTPPIEEPDAMTSGYFLDPCEGLLCSTVRRTEILSECENCIEDEAQIYTPSLEPNDG